MKTLFTITLLGMLAFGQSPKIENKPQVVYPGTDKPSIVLSDTTTTVVSSFTLGGPKGTIVSISMINGKVTFGEGYTPDAAAKEFWSFIEKHYPEVCTAKSVPAEEPAKTKGKQ